RPAYAGRRASRTPFEEKSVPPSTNRIRSDALHGLFHESVESDDREFQMLFTRVFQVAVADAVEALNEHHGRRHSRASNLGSVMQRAGGHGVRRATGLADGFAAQRDQVLVKQHGIDSQQALPRNRDVSLRGKTMAGLLRVSEHLGKRTRVEVALVKSYAELFDDAGHNVRRGPARTDGANSAVPLGDPVDFRAHLGGGEQGIPAPVHRGASRVRGLPVKSDGMALDTVRSED